MADSYSKSICFMIATKHHVRVVKIPAYYLGGPRFNLDLETGYPKQFLLVFLSHSRKITG
jgi:hypothetical protein